MLAGIGRSDHEYILSLAGISFASGVIFYFGKLCSVLISCCSDFL